jgi:SAM-dependent methyltransferase
MGTYSAVADEYYDSRRHPTCDNFREASLLAVRRSGVLDLAHGAVVCEVGPGRSLLADLDCLETPHSRLWALIDDSIRMLSYSEGLTQANLVRSIGDARCLPLGTGSVDLLFSVLGDSYNCDRFWAEVSRVLRPGGACVYTTPSWEWAMSFRSNGEAQTAEFILAGGDVVSLPSLVMEPSAQIEAIESQGMLVKDVFHISVESLKRPLSPKLPRLRPLASVVSAYTAISQIK